jgi:hypothetical protein
LEELTTRIDKLEKRDVQDFLTLLELMSNAHFFGGMKKTNCEYAKDGQCNLFYLQSDSKSKVPIATECRIHGCIGSRGHCHLEVSNITCTFCPQWNNTQNFAQSDKQDSQKRKNKCQE